MDAVEVKESVTIELESVDNGLEDAGVDAKEVSEGMLPPPEKKIKIELTTVKPEPEKDRTTFKNEDAKVTESRTTQTDFRTDILRLGAVSINFVLLVL